MMGISLDLYTSIALPCAVRLFPTRRSSDLVVADAGCDERARAAARAAGRPARIVRVVRHPIRRVDTARRVLEQVDRKSTRLNSSHPSKSYAVFRLKKKS